MRFGSRTLLTLMTVAFALCLGAWARPPQARAQAAASAWSDQQAGRLPRTVAAPLSQIAVPALSCSSLRITTDRTRTTSGGAQELRAAQRQTSAIAHDRSRLNCALVLTRAEFGTSSSLTASLPPPVT